MHDWTLFMFQIDWSEGRAVLIFRGEHDAVVLTAHGVVDIHVPRRQAWGPSDHVNKVKETTEDGLQVYEVEMQSGDCIKIVAASFQSNLTKV